MKDLDNGRVVTHFGHEYVWLRTESGALTLVSMDRLREAIGDIRTFLLKAKQGLA